MKRLSILVILLTLFFLLFTQVDRVNAQAPISEPGKLEIYLFWGEGCSHCAVAKPYLEDLAKKYPGIELKEYEVWYNEENQKLLTDMAAEYGIDANGVPTYFFGNYYMVGYAEVLNDPIEQVVSECLENGCPFTGSPAMIPYTIEESPTATPAAGTGEQNPANPDETPEAQNLIKVPLLGTVDLNKQSLAISTILIGIVDGVNPCSIWALTMLLALTIHTGSRKKVVIIGLVFLTVTAGIYALFIAGLFSVLKVVSFLGWVQVVVALVALFFAFVNIKDYFWYKEGVSFTIADDKKSGLARRMRGVIDSSQSTWGLIGATIVLAAGVSLVEFSCTAGFPVLWTNLLNAQHVTVATFVLLLLLYMVIYQLDELVIFFAAVFTLKTSRIEEKHGRILKLIGGMLMLSLSIVMLVKPALMNDLSSSLWIFVAAFAGTALILLVHRVILPAFGIRIGTEKTLPDKKNKH